VNETCWWSTKKFLSELGKNWKDIEDNEKVCKGFLVVDKRSFIEHRFSLISSKFLNETYTKRQ
jgi:hypothetical protein